MVTILKEGIAECILEPMGAHGLEGYIKGERYQYHECENTDKEVYYRVFPSNDSDYYEACGPMVFSKYFKQDPLSYPSEQSHARPVRDFWLISGYSCPPYSTLPACIAASGSGTCSTGGLSRSLHTGLV